MGAIMKRAFIRKFLLGSAVTFLTMFSSLVLADFLSAMKDYQNKNYEVAMAEFKRSAVLGHKASQFNIGVMYFRGEGVTPDPVESYAWLAVSATDKDPERVRIRDLVMSKMDEPQKN